MDRNKFDNLITDEFNDRLEEMQEAPYWQDTIAEIADSVVPVYHADVVELWIDLGMPEVDDTGLIEGVSDVSQIIRVAIYEYASARLYKLATDADLDGLHAAA